MKKNKKKDSLIKFPRVYVRSVVRWGSRVTDNKNQKQAVTNHGW
jgi:hypothetical protein